MAKNPKFTVLYEKLRGKTFEISKDEMSIGRREGADIQIQDGSVSGHHADIIRTQQDGETVYILRDNDSTNGTRINNVPITEQKLKNSDLIMFGNVEVLFDGIQGQGDDESDFSQITHTIDISNTDTNTATTQTLINFNPLAAEEKRKHALTQKVLLAGYVLLGIGALYLAYTVINGILSKK